MVVDVVITAEHVIVARPVSSRAFLRDAAVLSFDWREVKAAELVCRFLSFLVNVLVSIWQA